MTVFTPPLNSIGRALGVVGIERLCKLPAFAHVDLVSIADLLREFGRLAAEEIAPTDVIGDREGAVLAPATGDVRTPTAFKAAYRRYVEGGWGAMAAPVEHGGGGYPWVVALATQELFASANLALSLIQLLTQSAVELLRRWGSPSQQSRYMRRMLAGEWTGTMCLTESDAGSDLGSVQTRAEPLGDGTWAITGTKIFITWGEHDLAENIVHLVLARTPGAPEGTKGLSLFVVPKRLVNDDGSLGARNEVRCVKLEEKLGIHGSPTCVLDFRGAVGELVGTECRGMPAMFTMMNTARVSIGLQGVAVAERAYQQALDFAHRRLQGRSPTAGSRKSVPIIEHPDVRRMLVTISSSIDASRLLVYAAGAASDEALNHPHERARERAQLRCDLLTPIAKAWASDEGVRAASLALQIHGGMGYVEETGIAQRLRDARVAPIYEGTNGIQAVDLVMRKIRRDRGAAMRELIEELESSVLACTHLPEFRLSETLSTALGALRAATEWIADAAAQEDPSDALASASTYLDLAGTVIGGCLLARQAMDSVRVGGVEHAVAVQHANFFTAERLALAPAFARSIKAGASGLRLIAERRGREREVVGSLLVSKA